MSMSCCSVETVGMQKLTAPCLISPWLISLCLALMTSSARAQDSQQTLNSPAPTHANVSYGVHERQVLDFYRARKNTSRAPVLVWIHGGGWVRGDKSPVPHLERLLDRGIAVVSINYRYSWQAQLAKVDPPVSWPISDAVRAIQFIRSKADEWKLDTNRIAASGGSAGACSSLYLAFHADHATPTSADPIERFSSRILFAAVEGAQTSLDPSQLVEWTPNSVYGGHAFGFMDPNDLKTRDTRFAEFLANRSKVEPWIKAYSPWELVTEDDSPVYLWYKTPPALGQKQSDPTHSANYGIQLLERCKHQKVECELAYPNAPNMKHATVIDYILDRLPQDPS